MADPFMNRARRRARAKAARCLDAVTVVPAGVRAKLPAGLLRDMAARKGRIVDASGVVAISPATTAV